MCTPVSSSLKIAVISASIYPYNHGGIARWMTDLVPTLIEQGHDVRLITRSFDDNDPRPYLLQTPTTASSSIIPEAFSHLDNFSSGALEMLDQLVHDGWVPDIVYGTAWDCEVLAVIRSKRYKVVSLLVTPLQVTLQHSGMTGEAQDIPKFHSMIQLEKETIQSSTALHAISDSIIKTVSEMYSIDFAHLDFAMIPLGLPQQDSNPTRNKQPKILFVGRCEERKGIDIFLAAIPKILEVFPKTRFTVAGQEMPSSTRRQTFREIFRLSNTWSVRRRVKFLENIDDSKLHDLYIDHEITCIPSRYESFGLVAIEAMRCGSVPVVTPGSGLEEIVSNNVTGIIMQDVSIESLVHQVKELLANDHDLVELRKNAVLKFEESFEIGKTVVALTSFLHKVSQK